MDTEEIIKEYSYVNSIEAGETITDNKIENINTADGEAKISGSFNKNIVEVSKYLEWLKSNEIQI